MSILQVIANFYLTYRAQTRHDHRRVQPPRLVRATLATCLLFLTFCFARSCHSKCVSPRYAEPDLNKGESVCIDRCVSKFFEVNKKVCRLPAFAYRISDERAIFTGRREIAERRKRSGRKRVWRAAINHLYRQHTSTCIAHT